MNEDLKELLTLLLGCDNPNAAVPVAASIIFAQSQDELRQGQTAAVPQVNP